MSTEVTSDGQVTIPKWVCDYLDIGPGDEVVFSPIENDRAVLERADGKRPAADKAVDPPTRDQL